MIFKFSLISAYSGSTLKGSIGLRAGFVASFRLTVGSWKSFMYLSVKSYNKLLLAVRL